VWNVQTNDVQRSNVYLFSSQVFFVPKAMPMAKCEMPCSVHLSYAIKNVRNAEKMIEHALKFFFDCRKWMAKEISRNCPK